MAIMMSSHSYHRQQSYSCGLIVFCSRVWQDLVLQSLEPHDLQVPGSEVTISHALQQLPLLCEIYEQHMSTVKSPALTALGAAAPTVLAQAIRDESESLSRDTGNHSSHSHLLCSIW